MHEVHARIHVHADHTITGIAPPDVPAGEHEVTIPIPLGPARRPAKKKPFNVGDLPTHDLGPWPEGLRLRREEIYGEDGR